MPIKERPVLITISENISQRMPVESQNLNAGLMTNLVRITHDNIYIGAEVRDLTANPPVIGFITAIEEYGWYYDENKHCVAYSYYIIIKNCDGRTLEFDLDEISISPTLYLVERE
tara:strand:+ start:2842 stop:3186 length:345 start_codon:yes stop_codon:yes gene_type:complete